MHRIHKIIMNNNKSFKLNNNNSITKCISVFYIFMFLISSITFAQKDIDPNGYNKFFHKNGALSSEGNMKNGQPTGVWKTYYDTGEQKSNGSWKNGKLNGKWQFFRPDGTKERSISYVDGLKNGWTSEYDENGKKILESYYLNNQKDSIETKYYADGNIRQKISYADGKEDGESIEYGNDGRIITKYKFDKGFTTNIEKINRYDTEQKKVGVWKEFYTDGTTKKEQSYIKGVADGLVKEYDKNGSLATMKKFEDGILQEDAPELYFIDLYREYHPGGIEKLVGGKQNGKKQGIFREYDIKGKLINGYIYEDDNIVGEGIIKHDGSFVDNWNYYYLTGEKKAEGKYQDGLKQDVWIYYHQNKKIEQKGKYKKGKL